MKDLIAQYALHRDETEAVIVREALSEYITKRQPDSGKKTLHESLTVNQIAETKKNPSPK
jgi:hypothetical protein